MTILRRSTSILFAVIGLLCVLFPRQITAALPCVLGGAMAIAGVVCAASCFRGGGERAARSEELGRSLVLLVVGLVCALHGEQAVGPLGTTWAIIGLRKASKSLSRALSDPRKGLPFFAQMTEFLIRLTLSVLLLLDPMGKFETHVLILGLELIAVSLRLTGRPSPDLDC